MKETFAKLNDYTLLQTLRAADEETSAWGASFYVKSQLTRSFNFLSAQVTTISRDITFQSRGADAGGSSSVSTQTIIQNFSDIQSDAEIRLMHEKLKEKSGNPPPLDDILRGMGKKNTGLTPAAKG
ncbi:MAG: hypothetical protein Q8K65_10535 [Alphaproteobacteria bacterium]|nr:hypothetical protein [Alphaproteobacteria bacterium]